MVRLTRIYTGGGDKGQTSLGNGDRIDKCDLRVETYGTVDETNAHIAMAQAYARDSHPDLAADLLHIENDMFDLGADLCRPLSADKEGKQSLRLSQSQIDWLEGRIDHYNADLADLTSFILPGGTLLAAQLHLARTVCRRAERLCTALQQREPLSDSNLVYLNRLSDLLFVVARHANNKGQDDILWKAGANR